jgi:hypothetical protein
MKLLAKANAGGVGTVFFDEVHDRTMLVDFALQFVVHRLMTLKAKIRLIMSSATCLDLIIAEMTADNYLDFENLHIPGGDAFRTEACAHPPFNAEDPGGFLKHVLTQSAEMFIPPEEQGQRHATEFRDKGLLEILKQQQICQVFVPALSDAEFVIDSLKQDLQRHRVQTVTLDAQTAQQAKSEIIALMAKKCKGLLFSTAYAETAITIKEVAYVINLCVTYYMGLCAESRLPCSRKVRVTISAANQRGGRTGRVGPGKVLHLIENLDQLSSDLLVLYSFEVVPPLLSASNYNAGVLPTVMLHTDEDVKDTDKFKMFTKLVCNGKKLLSRHDPVAVATTLIELYVEGAIDRYGIVTSQGRIFAGCEAHPTHVSFVRSMITAWENGTTGLCHFSRAEIYGFAVCAIAAIIAKRQFFRHPGRNAKIVVETSRDNMITRQEQAAKKILGNTMRNLVGFILYLSFLSAHGQLGKHNDGRPASRAFTCGVKFSPASSTAGINTNDRVSRDFFDNLFASKRVAKAIYQEATKIITAMGLETTCLGAIANCRFALPLSALTAATACYVGSNPHHLAVWKEQRFHLFTGCVLPPSARLPASGEGTCGVAWMVENPTVSTIGDPPRTGSTVNDFSAIAPALLKEVCMQAFHRRQLGRALVESACESVIGLDADMSNISEANAAAFLQRCCVHDMPRNCFGHSVTLPADEVFDEHGELHWNSDPQGWAQQVCRGKSTDVLVRVGGFSIEADDYQRELADAIANNEPIDCLFARLAQSDSASPWFLPDLKRCKERADGEVENGDHDPLMILFRDSVNRSTSSDSTRNPFEPVSITQTESLCTPDGARHADCAEAARIKSEAAQKVQQFEQQQGQSDGAPPTAAPQTEPKMNTDAHSESHARPQTPARPTGVQQQQQQQQQMPAASSRAAPARLSDSDRPLTAAAIAAAPPGMQKVMLGEKLFPAIARMHPEMGGKITGVMLQMDNSELLTLLGSPDQLKAKVQEVLNAPQLMGSSPAYVPGDVGTFSSPVDALLPDPTRSRPGTGTLQSSKSAWAPTIHGARDEVPAGSAPRAATCSGCNDAVVKGARYCSDCGREIVVLACASCGHSLATNAKFCCNCGTPR